MIRTPPRSADPSPSRDEDDGKENPDRRTSRRQKGLQPEYGLLPEKTKQPQIPTSTAATMTDPVQPARILLRQPKEPPTFCGSWFEDPESCLEAYDRVALFNGWTSEDKLRHAYFALEDAAYTWFQNQERTLTTWGIFRTRFLATFTSVVRKEQAEALLETRVQMPNESLALFTEEMTRLFVMQTL